MLDAVRGNIDLCALSASADFTHIVAIVTTRFCDGPFVSVALDGLGRSTVMLAFRLYTVVNVCNTLPVLCFRMLILGSYPPDFDSRYMDSSLLGSNLSLLYLLSF